MAVRFRFSLFLVDYPTDERLLEYSQHISDSWSVAEWVEIAFLAGLHKLYSSLNPLYLYLLYLCAILYKIVVPNYTKISST
jgi:hypothetical protein